VGGRCIFEIRVGIVSNWLHLISGDFLKKPLGCRIPIKKTRQEIRSILMKYWLLKSEPSTYSWEDLIKNEKGIDSWDGVRNYQARNFLKEMAIGDMAFFYHSGIKIPGIVGIVKIVREAYPDPLQWDANSPYYDPKSFEENPRWVAVDIQAVEAISPPITLSDLRDIPQLKQMQLLKKGNRLSVLPLTAEEWEIILKLRYNKLKV